MENKLVRYSRAGDVFHYRWAACRCLKLINPESSLKSIIIEGSKERKVAGEYVIDVAEYERINDDSCEKINYFQLKHSTKRVNKTFILSDLKDTIKGFAERFNALYSKENKTYLLEHVKFVFVSNRKLTTTIKEGIKDIGRGNTANSRFQNTLKKYTQLKNKQLREFCNLLEFLDDEGDYIAQREKLRIGLSKLLVESPSEGNIDSVVALVQDRALPHSKGVIVREDVLNRIGVTSERELFPAPQRFEDLTQVIKREQHDSLVDNIIKNSNPTIIHASGGVGKSVVCRQLSGSLPKGSVAIVYDCFGAGKYRNRSEPRHRHRDALVQIVNEIASHTLCNFLIPKSTDLDDAFIRAFLSRLQNASAILRKNNPKAILAIFIDAVDNAEMASKEFSDTCFANDLLNGDVPEGCRIVMFSRTERLKLFKFSSRIKKFELKPFTKRETSIYLDKYFSNVSNVDMLEFHRLTGGNPRVQANALSAKNDNILDILLGLGPSGTNVNKQIEAQINASVALVKDRLPPDFQKHIDSICLGLANLPPFIPIDVLAIAAGVEIDEVKTFVADLGRSLLILDNFVQFRDEPTETWFRENFSASKESIELYVSHLRPLTKNSSYVSEVIPSLLLQSENYDELISLALSEDFLPEDSPVDRRNIQVYRLQFAFKASLKKKRYVDAIKLALCAGEEVAGDDRQMDLFEKNVDLIALLQSEQRVQEIAFRRTLKSGWKGSENVYSASLLSSVSHFKGEARSYLRSAENWLHLHFEERKKKNTPDHNDSLQDEDISELAFVYLNLFSAKELVRFILSWKPKEVIFRITRLLIRRIIDAGKFEIINEIAKFGCHNQHLMLAIADELIRVGKYPPKIPMRKCLDLLIDENKRIAIPTVDWQEYALITAIISFAEASFALKLSKAKILRVINYYFPKRASRSVSCEYQNNERDYFLRAIALKTVISDKDEPDLKSLMPKDFLKKKNKYHNEQDIKEFTRIIGGLLPWYIVRSRVLVVIKKNLNKLICEASERSRKARQQGWREYDPIPFETTNLHFKIIALNDGSSKTAFNNFSKELSAKDIKFRLPDRLNALRTACRVKHLTGIREQLEQMCSDDVHSAKEERPETRADWYINLARAILPINCEEASAYFNYAIEAVSKFGDEALQRWKAVIAIAKHSAQNEKLPPDLTYRFMRCSELIGEYIEDFDHDETINVCTQLNPSVAISTLSRWRDRDVGWFNQQISTLVEEMVVSKTIASSVAWSFSTFLNGRDIVSLAVLCIEHESDPRSCQYILDSAVHDLRVNDTSKDSYEKLADIAITRSLKNIELQKVINYLRDKESTGNNQDIHKNYQDTPKKVNWNRILNKFDLSSIDGISKAITCFKKMTTPRSSQVFWTEVMGRVPNNQVCKYLNSITELENLDIYDVKDVLSCFPSHWRRKASVKRIWHNILASLARPLALEFTNYHTFRYIFNNLSLNKEELSSIKRGILEGLSEYRNLTGAEAFFGFCGLATSFVSPEEARELLAFAISRFEGHIEESLGDGSWGDHLKPPENVINASTGLIWAALGAPQSATRWHAAHCVKRLGEAGCENEISALIEWMHRDVVNSFGYNKFPFYNYHAKQYLLMALARVALDNPLILKPHSKVFSKIAVEGMPHVLIQKYAKQIAIAIESAFPGTYKVDIYNQLQNMEINKFPRLEIEGHENNLNSPWHEKGEVDTSLDLYFSLDFDRYWFPALSDAFGISVKQIEELGREIILKEWHIKQNDKFIDDPRIHIWKSYRHERETWHSHFSYPRTDDYRFYLSYHAMLSVAAKLFNEMPIVKKKNYWSDEDPWSSWLERHTLIRSDGYWLADRRDFIPLDRPEWIYKKSEETGLSEIKDENFLEGLLTEREGKTWLNIYGSWDDCDSEHGNNENIYVSSALVFPETSQSLLNALTTCQNPHDFKLPNYKEEDMEFDQAPFQLKGWIKSNSNDTRIEEFDPHASEISYPPYMLGESFIKQFGLKCDILERNWYLTGMKHLVLSTEIWSSKKRADREGLFRSGNRMQASLKFLKKLCKILKYDLILKIEIQRREHKSYYSRSYNEHKYQPPHFKIYIFSENGVFRDTKKEYQIR